MQISKARKNKSVLSGETHPFKLIEFPFVYLEFYISYEFKMKINNKLEY